MRYRLDRDVELLDGGRAVLGGDPTRLLRLSAAGAATIARWSADGVDVAAATRAEVKLVDRLVAVGMMHPAPGPVDGPAPAVIVPVRDRVRALDRCLTALTASGVVDVVVVDDGSIDATASVATAEGAVCLQLPFNLGIGGALRTGFRYAVEMG